MSSEQQQAMQWIQYYQQQAASTQVIANLDIYFFDSVKLMPPAT
jgi:hypothetical protein